MATVQFFLLLLAISLTAVCARPQDEKDDEISNYIPQGDEADVIPSNKIDADATTVVNPETNDSKETATESVSSTEEPSTEETTTTTAPPRTSFFSRLIDDIVKIPGTVLKALNTFINNLGFRSQSSSSTTSSE